MEISVVIPVYNKAPYLDKCFESIFQQPFEKFEVVAVDDGSTDGSGELCDEWAKKDSRLHVIHTVNGGVTAAQLYIDMDKELQQLLSVLPVREGSIPTVLQYYESTDASSLARKLRSIEVFKGIPSPMKEVEGGFVPDFQSRYFTKDFPYGLALIRQMAHEKGVPTPTIDKVYEWGRKHIS